MTPLCVGVWGVGTWGDKHARVYDALEDVTLAGVYDQDGARAQTVAERYRCRAFGSAEELLEHCEAVSVAVPTVSHRQAVEQAAAAGRHALVEKPMAPTVADADAMLLAARRAGIQLQVGHVERFNPALLAARPHLSHLKFIEAHRLALFQPRSLDIDVVFDLMIHDIDAVLDAIGGPPSSVSAVGVAVLSENEDIANARLEFPDGCVANLTASRVSQERLRRIRFFQHDAYLSVDLFEKSCEMLRVGPERGSGEPRLGVEGVARAGAGGLAATAAGVPSALAGMAAFRRRPLEVQGGEPLTLQLQAFTASLRGRVPGAASGSAGRAALEVASAVRSAMRQRGEQWAQRSSIGS